jgi:hypothetical protein
MRTTSIAAVLPRGLLLHGPGPLTIAATVPVVDLRN